MASHNVERLLNVIMTIGSRPRLGIDRTALFAAIGDYADAASPEAAEKMFERDKAAIRDLGLPLRTERRDVWDENIVHYRFDTDTSGEDLQLSEGEYTVLLAASRAWDETAAGGAARRVRAKLLSQGLDADTDLLRRTPRGSVESLPVLGPLLEAVSSGSRVSFSYRTAAGTLSQRSVEPWIVAVHDGHWYLQGYDLDREGMRLFKASRIESFPRIGRPATHERDPEAGLERAFAGMSPQDDTAAAVLRIEPFKALALRDAAGASIDAEEVALPEMPRSAALRQVRTHARWITVLEPEPWRDALAAVYGEIADEHRGPADLEDIETARRREVATIRRPSSGADHLSRLVAIASYVLGRGEVEITQLAEQFGITQKELISDLQVLFVCGDFATGWEQDLIEVEWDSGFVRVRNADALARPLSITASEATALLAGLAALEPVAGEEARLVASARAKLLARLGSPLPDAPEAAVEDAPAAESAPTTRGDVVLEELARAIRAEESLVIRYSPPERPGTSVRRVRPLRVESASGRAYLRADCSLAGEERLFRLDRIAEILPADAELTVPGSAADVRTPADSGRLAEDAWLHLEGPAMWIAEAFGATELRDGPDGGTLALLPVPVRGALVSAVMESAGAAEVLAPASLRDLIVTLAEEAAARHAAAEAIV